jgi:hypothetical protein
VQVEQIGVPIEERARERKERTERGIERQRGERKREGREEYLAISGWYLTGT